MNHVSTTPNTVIEIEYYDLPDDFRETYATHYEISSSLKGYDVVYRADANHIADLIAKALEPVDPKETGFDLGEPYWRWDDVNDELFGNPEIGEFISKVPHYENGEEVHPFDENYCVADELADRIKDILGTHQGSDERIMAHVGANYLKAADPVEVGHNITSSSGPVPYYERSAVEAFLSRLEIEEQLRSDLLSVAVQS